MKGLAMIPTDKDKSWARGYAKQALSDLKAREDLVTGKADDCQWLHYLQMAAEKACKAHLTIQNGHENVKHKHTYTKKNLPDLAKKYLPILARHHWGVKKKKKKKKKKHKKNKTKEMNLIGLLSEEIELLSPACNDGGKREDNCEYPWENSRGVIEIPCEYKFRRITKYNGTIVDLIKAIEIISEQYAK